MNGGLFAVGSSSPTLNRFVRLGVVQRGIDAARSDLEAHGGNELERKLNVLLFTERRIKTEFSLENIARALAVPA